MKSNTVFIGLVAGLFVLGGCSGYELTRAKRVQPSGSEFSQNLSKGYLELSQAEYDEGDYRDSDNFARRARSTARNQAVGPEELTTRKLPAANVGELSDARSKLVAALDLGVADRDPVNAAKAQVMFDCWMQEQEENRQPSDIAGCKSGYQAAMAGLAPTIAALTAPPPAVQPARFVVYFDSNKAEINAAAQAVLDEAKAAVAKIGGGVIKVSGNADRVGSDAYNEMLSKARADAVAKIIAAPGVPVKAVLTEAHGERQPAVTTADGVAEPRNRRVEILIEP